MYSSDELFRHSREGYCGVYFPSCEATSEINTKITLEWAQKQFVTRVHASFCFFWFCWRRHNRLLMTSQWPDNCDAIMCIVISNSIDIDFIHGDIHGRSCKKKYFSTQLCFIDTSAKTFPSYLERKVCIQYLTCWNNDRQFSVTNTDIAKWILD